MKAIKSFILEVIEIFVISAAIILPIRYFLVQPFFVRGQSMEPMFSSDDYLVVDEISYRFREPKRGEVIVFKFPGNEKDYYIKRIIGLPGEIVEIKSGKVKIYNKDHPEGFVLNESYLPAGTTTEGDIRRSLGDDEYFVMGDNRRASYDSRRWGAVKRREIVGRVWVRLWPLNHPFIFAAPEYSQ
jgi:signal peptidase I